MKLLKGEAPVIIEEILPFFTFYKKYTNKPFMIDDGIDITEIKFLKYEKFNINQNINILVHKHILKDEKTTISISDNLVKNWHISNFKEKYFIEILSEDVVDRETFVRLPIVLTPTESNLTILKKYFCKNDVDSITLAIEAKNLLNGGL